MPDLDEQLRNLVEAAATPVNATEARQRTLHSLDAARPHRSSRHRWLAAAAVLALVVAGAVVVASRDDGDGGGPVVTDTIPEPTVTVGSGTVEVVADGLLWSVSDAGVTGRDAPSGIDASRTAAPTQTDHGLVALRNVRGTGELVLIDGDRVTRLADRVYAFSVDPTGQKVAAAQTPGAVNEAGGQTLIRVIDLRTAGSTAEVVYQASPGAGSNATPIGWAGPYVMVNLGDGAGSTAAHWRPGASTITVLGPGTVVAADDPSRPRALVSFGDSGCGAMVEILNDGGYAAEPAPLQPACFPSTVSRDGTMVASIDQRTRTLTVRTLQPASAATTVSDTPLSLDDDLAWLDGRSVAITDRDRVIRCVLPNTCTTVSVPRTGRSPIMIIRDRRSAGSAPPAPTTRPDTAASIPSTTIDPLAADPAFARLYSRVGEPAEDFAVRFVADVLGEATVFQGGEVSHSSPTRFSAVVRSTPGSVLFVVEMTVIGDGRHRFDRLASSGMDWSGADGTAVIPEPGRLTVTGFDGGLNPPGEPMITNLAVQRGNVTNLDLVESSWISLELTTANGTTLRYLGRR